MTWNDLISRLDPVYFNTRGAQFVGDSRDLLKVLPEDSIDLIMTSPPFALLRKKEYGNMDQGEYIDWLKEFGELAMRVLNPSGSLVLDLGGAYRKGVPVRSLYNYRVLIEFVDDLGFHLAEDFFWYNPARLPSPAEWVNRRKIRVTDAVNTVWWLSKTEHPKADVRNVLVPYSDAMKDLLKNPDTYYKDAQRPSEHEITRGFSKDNSGAIPKNLLQIANTASNTFYHRASRALEIKTHPARFPEALPEFFIKLLTNEGDLVLDIFSGSNTTGFVADRLNRQWLAFEKDLSYCSQSVLRFLSTLDLGELEPAYKKVLSGESLDVDAIVGSGRRDQAAQG